MSPGGTSSAGHRLSRPQLVRACPHSHHLATSKRLGAPAPAPASPHYTQGSRWPLSAYHQQADGAPSPAPDVCPAGPHTTQCPSSWALRPSPSLWLALSHLTLVDAWRHHCDSCLWPFITLSLLLPLSPKSNADWPLRPQLTPAWVSQVAVGQHGTASQKWDDDHKVSPIPLGSAPSALPCPLHRPLTPHGGHRCRRSARGQPGPAHHSGVGLLPGRHPAHGNGAEFSQHMLRPSAQATVSSVSPQTGAECALGATAAPPGLSSNFTQRLVICG